MKSQRMIVPAICLAFVACDSETTPRDALYSISPENRGGGIGEKTALGDLDGDGRPDFAVGHPADPEDPSSVGKVVAYSGQRGNRLWAVPADGRLVRAAGDANADGTRDVLIAIARDEEVVRVEVRSGRDGELLGWRDCLSALGARVEADGVGDVDGDGCADFVVFVSESAIEVVSGGTMHTMRRIALEPPGHGAELPHLVAAGDCDGDDQCDLAVWSETSPGLRVFSIVTGREILRFAERVRAFATVGDVDADGCADFLISLPEEEWVAEVRLVSGRSGGLLARMVEEDDFFRAWGDTIGSVGDVDGDGTGDFAIGDSSFDRFRLGEDDGLVEVRSGASGEVLRRIVGNDRHSWLGQPSRLGDVTGDGKPEILIEAHDGIQETWRVYVMRARP